MICLFFFSSRRRHTRCALVTGVQTCALLIFPVENWSPMMMPATDTSVVLRTWRYAASAQGTTERVKKRLFSCCHALALGVLITVNGVVAATPGAMVPVQTDRTSVV